MISIKTKAIAIVCSLAGVLLVGASAYAAVSIVSVKVTGPNALTVVYSEPVTTNTGDYSNFTGSLSGQGLVSLAGSGTNSVTLRFSGSALPPDATGYITIGPGVYGISDNTYFSGGTYRAFDGQPPTISSIRFSSNNLDGTFAGVGNTVTVSFDTNEQVVAPSITIAGHGASVTGGGTGPWTGTYTMQSGDSQNAIPIGVIVPDLAGNQLQASFSVTVGAATANGSQLISSITSNANYPGVLHSGNSIVFTLTPVTAQPNGQVSGSYNGVPLTWTTANGGATYTATYTVQSGQADEITPIQIMGVTLTANGYASAPAQGYDVQKTIDANVPILSVLTPVPVQTSLSSPSFTFTSTKSGTITYNGGCSGQTITAVVGANTIAFNPLANGTYGNCTILVTDTGGNLSSPLQVPAFTVASSGSSAPTTPTTPTTGAASTDALTSQIQALQSQLTQLQAEQSGAAASASAYTFTTFLGMGSRGAAVTALQRRLAADGFFSGSVTGYYGSLTEAAVKGYQTAHSINPKGYVGPGTRAALNAGK